MPALRLRWSHCTRICHERVSSRHPSAPRHLSLPMTWTLLNSQYTIRTPTAPHRKVSPQQKHNATPSGINAFRCDASNLCTLALTNIPLPMFSASFCSFPLRRRWVIITRRHTGGVRCYSASFSHIVTGAFELAMLPSFHALQRSSLRQVRSAVLVLWRRGLRKHRCGSRGRLQAAAQVPPAPAQLRPVAATRSRVGCYQPIAVAAPAAVAALRASPKSSLLPRPRLAQARARWAAAAAPRPARVARGHAARGRALRCRPRLAAARLGAAAEWDSEWRGHAVGAAAGQGRLFGSQRKAGRTAMRAQTCRRRSFRPAVEPRLRWPTLAAARTCGRRVGGSAVRD